jgi:hypothetical protein
MPTEPLPPLQVTDQDRTELVARQIRALLQEHQLAGLFMISAPEHCTYGLMLETAPWLRMAMVHDAEGAVVGIRVKSKLDEYLARGLSEEEAKAQQLREIGFTINVLDFFSCQSQPLVYLATQALELVRAKFDTVTTDARVGDAWGGKPQ